MLLVSNLIFDEDVILSCHYTVYDCRNDNSWHEARYCTIAKKIDSVNRWMLFWICVSKISAFQKTGLSSKPSDE